MISPGKPVVLLFNPTLQQARKSVAQHKNTYTFVVLTSTPEDGYWDPYVESELSPKPVVLTKDFNLSAFIETYLGTS